MTYAKQNIIKYQNRQRKETAKIVAYHFCEVLTAIAIFAFGYLWFRYV